MRTILLCGLAAVLAASRSQVTFEDKVSVIEYDLPSLSKSTSSKSRHPTPHRPARQSEFDSDDDDDDDQEGDGKGKGREPERVPKTRSLAHRSTSSQRSSSRASSRKSKEPANANLMMAIRNSPQVTRNPILSTIIRVVDAFWLALNDSRKYEFVDSEELAYYERRYGPIGEAKDQTQMLVRILRPIAWLLAHLYTFYDFPFGSTFWGLMLIADIAILLGWRQFDETWMLTELGHWDYAFGLLIFVGAGLISLLHQGVNFISKIFFFMAPILLIAGYTGVLAYAAFKKPHHYY